MNRLPSLAALVTGLAAGACGSSPQPPQGGGLAAEGGAPDAAAGSAAPDGPTAPATGPPLQPIVLHEGERRLLTYLSCAMSPAGDGVVAWSEQDADGRQSQVWATQLPRDQPGWQPARPLRPAAMVNIGNVSTVVDGQGRALAVWNESDGTAGGVAVARFMPAAGWSTPATLVPGWFQTLVGSVAGEAVAYGILRERIPMPALLRYTPDSGWEPDSGLEPPRAGFFFADPLGRGLLVWNQPAGGGGHELWVSRHPFRGSWGEPARVQEPRAFAGALPMVDAALAADGSGLLVWNRGGGVQGELWAAAAADPSTWQEPHRLSYGEAPRGTTKVLVNEGGDGLVVWETGNVPSGKVWAAHYQNGRWQPSVMLGQGAWIVTGALSSSGTGLVTWSTPSGVFARRSAGPDSWGALSSARNGAEEIVALCAGADNADRAFIVWVGGAPPVVRAADLPL